MREKFYPPYKGSIAYYNQAPERHVISEGKEYLPILEREVYGSYGSKADE